MLNSSPDSGPQPGGELLPPLTRREGQVLPLVVDGATDRQIAFAFGLSPETVAQYVKSIRVKWNLSNRTELASFALRGGHVDPGDGARPGVVEVEWAPDGQVLELRFRYLSTEGARRAPRTQSLLLNNSLSELGGSEWRTKTGPLIEAIERARRTEEAVGYSGSVGRLEETGEDHLWAGSISRVNDTHYLVITENFPAAFSLLPVRRFRAGVAGSVGSSGRKGIRYGKEE